MAIACHIHRLTVSSFILQPSAEYSPCYLNKEPYYSRRGLKACAVQTFSNIHVHLLCAQCLGEAIFSCPPWSHGPLALHVLEAGCECFMCGGEPLACHGEVTALPNLHLLTNCFCWQWVLFLPSNYFVSLVNEKHYTLKLINVKTHTFSL